MFTDSNSEVEPNVLQYARTYYLRPYNTLEIDLYHLRNLKVQFRSLISWCLLQILKSEPFSITKLSINNICRKGCG